MRSARCLLAPLALLAATAGIAACGGESPREDDAALLPLETPPAGPAPDSGLADRRSLHPGPVAEAVADFQELGFFAGEGSAAAARRVRRAYRREWGEELRVRTLLDEFALLEYDRDRVWWQDVEADALEGNDVYVDTLRGWARISRGAFRPRAIREAWDSPEGDATIHFTLDGRRRTVRAGWADAWIDLCVLPQVNRLIRRSGRRLEMVRAFDQTAYILALTRDERRRLERRRGWRFASAADLRVANELGRAGEEPVARGC